MNELQFDVKIKSGDKLLDKINGDWQKVEKAINEKYENIFGGKKKK